MKEEGEINIFEKRIKKDGNKRKEIETREYLFIFVCLIVSHSVKTHGWKRQNGHTSGVRRTEIEIIAT